METFECKWTEMCKTCVLIKTHYCMAVARARDPYTVVRLGTDLCAYKSVV